MTRRGHDPALDQRVGEVRHRLRELGYLGNPLESFLVGGAPRGASLGTLAGVAARLGLVGGLLVGLLVWLATVAINPALLRVPGDLALLAVYLLVIYVAAVAAIAALVGGVLLAVVRLTGPRARLGAAAPSAGALALALTFLYGTLWWRAFLLAADSASVLSAPNLLACLLIVLVTLLMGRLARLSAALLVEVGAERRDVVARRKRREAVRAAAVGVLASALFFAYLLAADAGRAGRPEAESAYDVALPSTPCLLIGIDGLAWDEFHYLAASGDLPHLAALAARSVRAPLDASRGGPPPEVWTTIATGEAPLEHGVRSFVRTRFAGMRSSLAVAGEGSTIASALTAAFPPLSLARNEPVSGLTRARKALWEIVGEKGFSASAVNWWATWPTADASGAVVSERAFARLSIPGSAAADLSSDVAPTSLAPLVAAAAESAIALVARAPSAAAGADAEAARLARAGDLFAIDVAARLIAASGRARLVAVYLPGLDILVRPLLSGGSAMGLGAIDVRVAEVRRHARAIDAEIGRAVDAAGPQSVTAIVTTPGGSEAGERSRAPGLFAMAGPGVRGPGLAAAVLPEEVAPTLLAYLGFPTSREMAGAARTDLISDDLLAARPPRVVASFGVRRLPEATGPAEDEEFLERLRSLGYIR